MHTGGGTVLSVTVAAEAEELAAEAEDIICERQTINYIEQSGQCQRSKTKQTKHK